MTVCYVWLSVCVIVCVTLFNVWPIKSTWWPWAAARQVLSRCKHLLVMRCVTLICLLLYLVTTSLTCMPSLLPCRQLGEECGLLVGSCCGGEGKYYYYHGVQYVLIVKVYNMLLLSKYIQYVIIIIVCNMLLLS